MTSSANDNAADFQNAPDQPSRLGDVKPVDVLRYRYHHGTNLGSIFVLEKWLTPSMFPPSAQDSQSSELEAAKLWIRELGLAGARAKFEEHWATTVSDADIDWLVNNASANAIRLPVGFFTLGPAFCNGTAFAPVAGIYENAWMHVRTLVQRLYRRGIGVLLDMHALPGGANGGDHSGTNSGKAALWGNPTNLSLAKNTLLALLTEATKLDGVIGVQVVNEADCEAKGMYDWYDSLLSGFADIDSSVPVYISDAWNLTTAVNYSLLRNKLTAPSNPVVIDTHLYWCFSDADKAKSSQQIITEPAGKLTQLTDGGDGRITTRGGAVGAVVGEYSDVLSEESWAKARSGTRDQLVLQFGQTQSANHQNRTGGSFFWTYKMDWMPGGEWGFKEQTDKRAIVAPAYLNMSFAQVQGGLQKAEAGKAAALAACMDAHIQYWSKVSPDQTFQHWRYEQGWCLGFNDATAFYGMRSQGQLGNNERGGDKIGMLELWIRKRIYESGQRGSLAWEFEQGFRKGVSDFGRLSGAY